MGSKRIWEIDFFRATAIILMVIFHTLVDLNQFVGVDNNYLSGFWYWEGKAAALIFIFLAGISSGFSKDNLIRGGRVLAYGMLITLFTYIFVREQYIRFGILHFLGVSMILFPFFKRLNNSILLILAALISLAALPIDKVTVNTGLLLPFGVMYGGFATLDYYPFIPYFSVFILGILAYKKYYFQERSIVKFSCENKYITTLSKYSLVIYLVHQPVIISMIFIYKFLVAGKI